MTDQWNIYPSQMGERRVFIFYDHGISESIDAIAPGQLLRVRARLQESRPDGMPTDDEFSRLEELERRLEALVEQLESMYVGRVTVDGYRQFYIYTRDAEGEWAPLLRSLGNDLKYSLAFDIKPDERHEGYWRELYPTDDDWQVIMDLQLIDVLLKNGDDGTTKRCIDHWAYFPSPSAAESFSQWVNEHGYRLVASENTDDGQFQVRFSHEGSVQFPDISSLTIALRRKSIELGGKYDGWETPACRAPNEVRL
jgi:hypothetical protein